MKKNLVLCLLVAAAASGVSAAQTIADAASTNGVVINGAFINQLADEARTNNPAQLAAAARVIAAGANQRSVRTWEDPMATVGGMIAPRRMRADEGDLVYGVAQELPLFGKPQARRRTAEAQAAVEAAAAEASFQQLRRDIALAVLRIALAERVVHIGLQDLAWLDTQVNVVERRYETGDATQFDVLRLENERARRATQLENDRDALTHEHVNLNRLLNRPLDSPWPEFTLPAVAGPVAYNDALVDLAVQFEPELIIRRRQIREAKAAVEVAQRERYPTLAAGAEVRNYSRDGDFRQGMLTLSFNLPWGNAKRYRAAIEREKEMLKATTLDAADFELALRDEIHQLTVNIEAARRDALTYRDQIIPRSESALESARAAWETNRGMFRDVLDARRMLLDAQLMFARAVTQQYQMMANLVLCCGLGDLEALEMIGALPDTSSPDPSD